MKQCLLKRHDEDVMKKIAILGSTGSIGTQTLEVVRRNPDLKVTALAAGRNIRRLEEQIRARISELDRAIVDIDETYGDILLKACREGNRSGNPEFYFKSLSSAAEEIDDKTFLEELNNFDEQSMKAFKSKYLSTPTVIDELLAGTHVVKGDYDEEDEVAEKVVIETEKWEQDYKLWMEEFKTKKTKKERDELYEAKDSIGSRLPSLIPRCAEPRPTVCWTASEGIRSLTKISMTRSVRETKPYSVP